MNYIENVYACLSAPIFMGMICVKGRIRRIMVFLLVGMTVCLLSSYISTFVAVMYGAGLSDAALEISPLYEEIMKLLPIIFFLLVFEPKREDAREAVMMTAVGFATFENVCFMVQNGAGNIVHLLIRGFGTGAMHTVAGSIMAFGILNIWNSKWIRAAGTLAFLAIAATYHGVFNILVSQEGAVAVTGYFIPLFTAVLLLIFRRRHKNFY